VAHNLLAMGASVRLVGLAGTDEAGDRVAAGSPALGCRRSIWSAPRNGRRRGRLRIVTTRHQQVARVDYEETATSTARWRSR